MKWYHFKNGSHKYGPQVSEYWNSTSWPLMRIRYSGSESWVVFAPQYLEMFFIVPIWVGRTCCWQPVRTGQRFWEHLTMHGTAPHRKGYLSPEQQYYCYWDTLLKRKQNLSKAAFIQAGFWLHVIILICLDHTWICITFSVVSALTSVIMSLCKISVL